MNGTYDVPVRSEVTDAAHRPIRILKQELDEVDYEPQWTYIAILRHKNVRTRLQESPNV